MNDAGEIIAVEKLADGRRKRDAGNHRHNAADDHPGCAERGKGGSQQFAEQRDEDAAPDIGHETGMAALGGKKIQLEQESDRERGDAVQQRSAEKIAEACRAQCAGEDVRHRALGDECFCAAKRRFCVVDGQITAADFA